MTESMRIRVLDSLARHPGGRTARELAADLELDSMYAIVHVNGMTRKLGLRGDAEFIVEESGYHNSKRYRWHITDSGRAELEHLRNTPSRELARERELAARRDRERKLTRRRELLAEWRQRWELGEIASRDGVIRWLRQEGCMLDEIGDVFGITRERVRQICRTP